MSNKFTKRTNSFLPLIALMLFLWWLGYWIAGSLAVPWTGLSKAKLAYTQFEKDLGGAK